MVEVVVVVCGGRYSVTSISCPFTRIPLPSLNRQQYTFNPIWWATLIHPISQIVETALLAERTVPGRSRLLGRLPGPRCDRGE